MDSIALSPTAALLAATRDAARAIGGDPGRSSERSRPDTTPIWCSCRKNPLENIDNLDSVELVMRGGRIWRPGQLRSGIAMR